MRAFIVATEYTTAGLAEWVWPRGQPKQPYSNMWRIREEARKYAEVIGRTYPGGLKWRLRTQMNEESRNARFRDE
jgi:hypothetical protein